MKVDLLGAKCLPSAGPINHAVVPLVGFPAASVHVNAAPPHSWTSIPRCRLYQARSATGSFALKKIPPTPVTLFIQASYPSCLHSLALIYIHLLSLAFTPVLFFRLHSNKSTRSRISPQ